MNRFVAGRRDGICGRFAYWAAVIAIVLASYAAAAKDGRADDPAHVVNHLVTEALGALGDKEHAGRELEHKFRALLDADFDLPRITRFVLGNYWSNGSDEDRRIFSELFEQWVIQIYAGGLTDFDRETVQIVGSRTTGETGAVVSSRIVHGNGDPPDKVDWILRRGDTGFKIIDVTIEGVSLVLTAREQIAAAIDHNGGTVRGANAALRLKLANAEQP